MIIIVCTDDPTLVGIAQQSSQSSFATFGNFYQVYSAPIPQIGANENLFIIAHGAYHGDDGNAVIGDQAAAFYVNGVHLWENIQSIFPQGYAGNVYIDACEAADHDDDTFSFAEVFMTQIQSMYGATQVYGRNGIAAGLIPLPTDPNWVLATDDVTQLDQSASVPINIATGKPVPTTTTGSDNDVELNWPASDDYQFDFSLNYDKNYMYQNTTCQIISTDPNLQGVKVLPFALNTINAAGKTIAISMKVIPGTDGYQHDVWCEINVPGFDFEGVAIEFYNNKQSGDPTTCW